MRRSMLLTILVCVIITQGLYSAMRADRQDTRDQPVYYPNTLIICFDADAIRTKTGDIKTTKAMGGYIQIGLPSFDQIARDYNFTDIERMFWVKNQDWRDDNGVYPMNIFRVTLNNDTFRNNALAALRKEPSVIFAEPEAIMYQTYIPDDPLFSQQYHHALIQSIEMWDLDIDASEVVVAICDSGVKWNHADFGGSTGNIYINEAELPGMTINWANGTVSGGDGIDNDGNGKVDDVIGWDFYGGTNQSYQAYSDSNGKNNHGTHVAGIVGAIGNNAIGLSGVAMNVKLLVLRHAPNNSYTNSIYNAYEGIYYAADSGADIINCSWGGSGSYSSTANTAVNYATNAGALVVVAAGNADSNIDIEQYWPACATNALTVGSSNQMELKSTFSNFGNAVDVMAPGSDIYSTSYNGSGSSATDAYVLMSGTSMASPVVAGLAAMVKAANPDLTPLQIKQAIIETCDIMLQNTTGRYTGLLGTGRVNALRAVTFDEADILYPVNHLTGYSSSSKISLSWVAPFTNEATGFNVYKNDIFLAQLPLTTTQYEDTNITAGVEHSYSVTAIYGEEESRALTVVVTPEANYIQIGAGDFVSSSSDPGPVNIWYKSLRGQFVITATELALTGLSAASEVTEVGFYVQNAPIYSLPNYHVRIKHTTATDASEHDNGPFTVTQIISSFTPVAGQWNYITLPTSFIWNGIDNILIDTAFNLVPAYNASGQTRIFAALYGYRYVIDDYTSLIDYATDEIVDYKPQVRLKVAQATSLVPPANLTAVIQGSSVILSWLEPTTATPLGYNVYRDSQPTPLNETLIQGSTYTDTNVVVGGVYTYTVRAMYTEGESTDSSTATVLFIAPSADAFVSTFEDGSTDGWVVVNGNEVNKWMVGGATAYASSKSIYISNNNSDNLYTYNTASTTHIFRDMLYTQQTGNTLSFDYKGVGESGYDFLCVYLCDTSYTPLAGSYPTGTQLATYNGYSNWTNLTINLPNNPVDTTKRIVFTWRNDTSVVGQPPAALDNIVLNRGGTQPVFRITPVSYNLGSVAVGATSGARTFTVSNTGGDALTVTAVILTGANTADFSLNVNDLPWSIPPNQGQTFTVSLAPLSVGPKAATVNIAHQAAGGVAIVTLSGIGVDPSAIATLPYSQDFSAPTFPPQEPNWVMYDIDNNDLNWYGWEGVARSDSYQNTSTISHNNWLISPLFEFEVGQTYIISFDYRSYSPNFPDDYLYVYRMTGNSVEDCNPSYSGNTSIFSQTTTANWQTATISYTPTTSISQFIGFRHYSSSTYVEALLIDNVRVYAREQHDLGIISFTGPAYYSTTNPFVLNLRNHGTANIVAGSYAIQFYYNGPDDQGTLGEPFTATPAISAGSTASITINDTYGWGLFVNQITEYEIYAQIIYSPDTTPDNNISYGYTTIIYPQPTEIIDLTSGALTNNSVYPVAVSDYRYSLSQAIYTESQLGGVANYGPITQLMLRLQSYSTFASPVQIYLANAPNTLDIFSNTGDYYPYENFVKVYDAPFDIPAGQNGYIDFPITLGTGEGAQEFIYEGGNIVMMMHKADTLYGYNNYWNNTNVGQYRGIYMYTNTAGLIDIEHPNIENVYNGRVQYVPKARFFIERSNSGTLSGTVTATTTGTPISGAQVYLTLSPSVHTYTNSSGAYILPGIPINRDISVEAFRYYSQDISTDDIVWLEDEETGAYTATKNIVLQPLPSGLTIAGMVETADGGVGLNGVRVTLSGYIDAETTTITLGGINGFFMFTGLYGEQTYTLSVDQPGYAPISETIELTTTSVNDVSLIITEHIRPPLSVRAEISPFNSANSLITWYNPLWGYSSFSHTTPVYHNYGSTSAPSITMAHRYTPAQLANFSATGNDIFKVGFIPYYTYTYYTHIIKIWVTADVSLEYPEGLDPVLTYEVPTGLTQRVINEIALPTLVNIPAGSQLFVGVEIIGGGNTIYTSLNSNNTLAGYSDLLFIYDTWTTRQNYWGSSYSWCIYVHTIEPEDPSRGVSTPVVYSTSSPVRSNNNENTSSSLIDIQSVEDVDIATFDDYYLGYMPNRATRALNGTFQIYRMLSADPIPAEPIYTTTATDVNMAYRDLQYIDTEWDDLPEVAFQYAVKSKYTGSLYEDGYITSDAVYSNSLFHGYPTTVTVNVASQALPITGAVVSLTNTNVNTPNQSYTLQASDNGSHTFTVYMNIPYEVRVVVNNITHYSHTQSFTEDTNTLNINLLPTDLLVDLMGGGSSSNSYHPMRWYYRHSYSQTIYTADQLGGIENYGTILQMMLRANDYSTPTSTPVQIYLANAPTTLTSFANYTDYYPYENFVKVYDAPLLMPPGYNIIKDILFPLGTGEGTQEFVYEGGNIVMMVFKADTTNRYENINWYHTPGVSGVNRSLFTYNYDYPIDIQDPNPYYDYGTLTSFPKVRFYMQKGTLGTLSGTVRSATTNLPIAGAVVYVTTNPEVYTTTSSSGAYTLTNVPINRDVSATAFTYYTNNIDYTTILWEEEEETGAYTATKDITLSLLPTGLSITGTVQRADSGEEANGVRVTLSGYLQAETTSFSLAGMDGIFIFNGLYGGATYTITAHMAGFTAQPVTVNIGTTNVSDALVILNENIVPPHAVTVKIDTDIPSQTLVKWYNPLWGYSSFSHARPVYTDYSYDYSQTLIMAHRYTPTHLESFNAMGYDIFKVGFIPVVSDNTYTVKVWVTADATKTNPAGLEPVATVTVPSVITNQINEVTLPTPVHIPPDSQLFVGVETYGSIYTYSLFNNFQNPLPDYSDLFYVGGQWRTMSYWWNYSGSWCIYVHAIEPENPDRGMPTPVVYSNVVEDTSNGDMENGQIIPSPLREKGSSQSILAEGAWVANHLSLEGKGINSREQVDPVYFPDYFLGHMPNRVTRALNGEFNIYRMIAPDYEYTSLPVDATLIHTTQPDEVNIGYRDMQYADTSWPTLEEDVYRYAITTTYQGSQYDGGSQTSPPRFSNNQIKATEVVVTVNVTLQGSPVSNAVVLFQNPNPNIPNQSYTLQADDNGSHSFTVYMNTPYELRVSMGNTPHYSQTYTFTEYQNIVDITLIPTDVVIDLMTNYGNNSYRYHPVDWYYRNSLSQTIYTSDQLGGYANFGTIQQLLFRINDVDIPSTIPVQIYLANAPTTLTAFNSSSDYYPYEHFVKVYDAPLPLPPGEWIIKDILLPLGTGDGTEEFMYEGGNIVMMMYRTDTTYYNSSNYWYHTWSGYGYRSVYMSDDSQPIDIENPDPAGMSVWGWLSSFPLTRFYIQRANLGTLSGTVKVATTQAPLEGARVYVTNSPVLSATTDANGVYTLPSIPTTRGVTVSAFSYHSQNIPYDELEWIDSTGDGDYIATLNAQMVSLPTGLSIGGQVLSTDSNIGVNTTVVLSGYMDAQTTTFNIGPSSGFFMFNGLYGGVSYTLTVNKPGFQPTSQTVTLNTSSIMSVIINITELITPPLYVTAEQNPDDPTQSLVNWINPLWGYSSFSHTRPGYDGYLYDWMDAPFSYTMAHRYTPTQIASFGASGYDLFKVAFIPYNNSAGTSYAIKVWVTPDANMDFPEEIDPVLTLAVPTVTPDVINEVLLPAMVPVAEGSQLFVGVEVSRPNGYIYLRTNSMNTQNGYSNLVQYKDEGDEEWSTTYYWWGYNRSWCIYLTTIEPANSSESMPVRSTISSFSVPREARLYTETPSGLAKERATTQLQAAHNTTDAVYFDDYFIGHRPNRVTRALNGTFQIYRMLSDADIPDEPIYTTNASEINMNSRDMHYIDTEWLTLTDETYKYAVRSKHTGTEYDDGYILSEPVYSNPLYHSIPASVTVNVTLADSSLAGAVITLTNPNPIIPNQSYTFTEADAGSCTFNIFKDIPYVVSIYVDNANRYSRNHIFSEMQNTLDIDLLAYAVIDLMPDSPTSTKFEFPVNYYYSNSLSQVIYTATELGGVDNFGQITNLMMRFYNANVPEGIPIKIYLANAPTSLNSFNNSGNYYPYSNFTMVYNAPLPLGNDSGQWIDKDFLINIGAGNGPDTQNFVYEGGNIVMMMYRVSTNYYSISNVWHCNPGTSGVNRSIYIYTNNQPVPFSPQNPFTTGYNLYNGMSITYPKIRFYLERLVPVTVSGTVVDVLGSPIASANVYITRASPLYTTSTTTNASGAFTLQNVPANADYTVTVSKTGYSTASVEITVGNTDYVIEEPFELSVELGETDGVAPAVTALRSNYPNPFNPTTTIAFDTHKEGLVVMEIYNIKGQKVKSLVNEVMPAGYHKIEWNGNDESGRAVGSGVYFYRMVTGDYVAVKKMVMLK